MKFQTHIHQMVGRRLKEVKPSSLNWSDLGEVRYIIGREEIESCDTSRLIHDLRPELDNPLFKAGAGNVSFRVHGYDDDPRDLLQIPEFRAFCRKMHQEAVCWLYFAMPGNAWLRIMAAGSSDCQIVVENGVSRVAITKGQVADFIQPQINEYLRLRKLTGAGGDDIDEHVCEMMRESFPEIFPS